MARWCLFLLFSALAMVAGEEDGRLIHKLRHGNTPHHRSPLLGAAVYLVNKDVDMENRIVYRKKRLCGLRSSLEALAKNWRPHNPYPVILLNNQPFTNEQMKAIRKEFPTLDIMFANIANEFNILSESEVFEDHARPFYGIDYKRMCAYWFSEFLKTPTLMDYRYLFRLDDDTCILDPINYDIFKEMESRGVYYAYQALDYVPYFYAKELNNFTERYIAENNITVANPYAREIVNIRESKFSHPAYPAFLSNLEVIDTYRYRAPDIQHFLNAVMDSKNIFHKGWGDAFLRFTVGELFWGPHKVLRLCEFSYQHSNWDIKQQCEGRFHYNNLRRVLNVDYNIRCCE